MRSATNAVRRKPAPLFSRVMAVALVASAVIWKVTGGSGNEQAVSISYTAGEHPVLAVTVHGDPALVRRLEDTLGAMLHRSAPTAADQPRTADIRTLPPPRVPARPGVVVDL